MMISVSVVPMNDSPRRVRERGGGASHPGCSERPGASVPGGFVLG